jgi:type IV pilus biogenesis protein CpaD/CtpE
MYRTPHSRRSPLPKPVAIAAVLLLAACASTPPAPTASLQAAKQAISEAERADAGRYAPEELGDARTRLTSADAAVAEKKMLIADRYAQESRLGAELALAKTSAVKANAVNEEMKRGTGTLIEEMQRNAGDKP